MTEIKENNTLNINWDKIRKSLPPKSKRAKNATKQKGKRKHKPVGGSEEIKARVSVSSSNTLTKVVALDCEMVGIGHNGREDALARVSIVNYFGECIFDRYVHVPDKVTDYRTHVSGIRAEDIENGHEFSDVMTDVHSIIKDRIVVGHDLRKDFKLLYICHSEKLVRDTSNYGLFRGMFGGKRPSLKNLALRLLQTRIQEGEHDSIADAAAAMRIYKLYRKEWEDYVKKWHKKSN